MKESDFRISARRSRLSLSATLGSLLISLPGSAAVVAFYTDSGFGVMDTSNAHNWGGSNKTNSSVIFEVFIDYSVTVANSSAPFALFELGADAFGSGIAIDGTSIIFAAGGGSVAETAIAVGLHGLAAGQSKVQVVGAIELDAGTGGINDLLSLYVNGRLVATADAIVRGNDWAGVNASNLGTSDSFNIFEYVPSLNPNAGDGANGIFAGPFPDTTTTITFAAYEMGVGDNTVENILIPEPNSLILLGLSGLLLARKRPRA